MKVSLYLAAPGSRFWAAASTVSLAEAIAVAAGLGYDAVEVMPLDAADPDPETLRAMAERHGLSITGLATGYVALEQGLTFTHPDPEVRRQAVRAACRCLDSARRAGAPLISIGIIRGKLQGGTSREDAWPHLVNCVRECGLYAGELDLTLTIEPGNRYETDFVHTVDEGLDLLDAVNLPSVRLQLDTFHMNIEEASPADAVRRAGPHLAHVHFADSNRRAPGWGHLDFRPIAGALRDAGYAGAIGLEMLLIPDLDAAARQGLRFVRRLFGDA